MDRHVIVPGSRLYCVGTATRPCPAHAWWYHEGAKGRPRLRCDVCRRVRALEVSAESAPEKARAPRCPGCGHVYQCHCRSAEAA